MKNLIEVNFPTFKNYLESNKNIPITDLLVSISRMTTTEFINSNLNDKNLFKSIILDEKYFNIIIDSSTFDKLNEDNNLNTELHGYLSKITDKEIMYYTFKDYLYLICLGKPNLIFEYIDVVGNFDLIIIDLDGGLRKITYFANKYQSKILAMADDYLIEDYNDDFNDSPLKFNSVKISDNFKIIAYNFNGTSNKIEIFPKNNDILIGDLDMIELIYGSDILSCMDNLIINFIENTKVSIKLNKNKFNILVMCAEDKSIINEVYKNILEELNCSIEKNGNEDIYYVGYNINIPNKPYINRVSVENLKLIGDTKFDLVISEHCPFSVILNNSNLILSLMAEQADLISPFYKNVNKDVFQTLFKEIIRTSDNHYSIFTRI